MNKIFEKVGINWSDISVEFHLIEHFEMDFIFPGFLLSLILIIGEKIWFHHKAKKRKKNIGPYTKWNLFMNYKL